MLNKKVRPVIFDHYRMKLLAARALCAGVLALYGCGGGAAITGGAIATADSALENSAADFLISATYFWSRRSMKSFSFRRIMGASTKNAAPKSASSRENGASWQATHLGGPPGRFSFRRMRAP